MKTFSAAKSHRLAERMFSASLILMRKEGYSIQEEQLLSVPLYVLHNSVKFIVIKKIKKI